MTTNAKSLLEVARIPLIFCAILGFIHVLSIVTGISGAIWGIRPRVADALPGIFFAPLIHGDIPHLMSNVGSLLLLGTALWFFYPRIAARTIALAWPLTGLMVWVFGQQSGPHIGASGLVYALIGILISLAIFRRSMRAGMIAVAIGVLYSGSAAGLLPQKEGHISWESHAFGALVGLLCGFLFRKMLEPEEKEDRLRAEQALAVKAEMLARPKGFFFQRDVFDKTLAHRAFEAEAELAALEAKTQQNWVDNLMSGLSDTRQTE